jgi:hypothetical protein
VPNHGRLWPADQRFDYLVRLRPLSKQELTLWQDRLKEFRPALPQTASLLYALRELTGEDPGPSVADWQRLYSPVTGQRLGKPLEPGDRADYLKDSLVKAPPPLQAQLLADFRDRGGPAYDRALALAIPDLTTDLQKLARTVLADRSYCLPHKELRDRLRDKSPEMRRAAACVCKLRQEKVFVPDLLALLEDDSPDVARQAYGALRQVTGRDFGPVRGSDGAVRPQALAAWRDWWEQAQRLAERKRAGL